MSTTLRPNAMKPSQATPPNRFDRFATAVAGWVARGWFFAACVALVVAWGPTILLVRDIDTWQLLINTPTTIITFLLVALIQNTQARDSRAVHRKLNAIADAVADLMESTPDSTGELVRDVDELRAAVGLESREGT